MQIEPERIIETPAEKAARRKHAKQAIRALLTAAARMERAKLPLVTITGAIGEAWAVAELAMQPFANAAAAYDGWLPDGSTVDVKCRYAPRGSSTVILSPEKAAKVDLLVAIEIDANKQVSPVYVGPYSFALEAGVSRRNGAIAVRWLDFQWLQDRLTRGRA